MKEVWKIFKDRITGKELAAYTLRGTFPGEERETKNLLAAEFGIEPHRIITTLEKRESRT